MISRPNNTYFLHLDQTKDGDGIDRDGGQVERFWRLSKL